MNIEEEMKNVKFGVANFENCCRYTLHGYAEFPEEFYRPTRDEALCAMFLFLTDKNIRNFTLEEVKEAMK